MLMNIWVKDKTNGKIHQVGTDEHDSLMLMDGLVHYYNMQNGTGTVSGYEFVEAPDLDDYVSVTPEQMYINRANISEALSRILINSEEDESKNLYNVTVTRTGGIAVRADSSDEAIERVNSMSADEINMRGNLTGWEASDAELVEKDEQQTVQSCIDTPEHGSIWGEIIDFEKLKEIAAEKKFLKDNIKYFGNIVSYEQDEYMMFRSDSMARNFLILVKKGKKRREK